MFAARDIPNLISIGRILLVFPIIWLLLDQQFGVALLLFFIAGVSDGLDGFLAKHFHWESRFGGIIDPLADKFMLVSAYLCLGWLSALPWWLVGLIILRDVVIVIGGVVYHYTVERVDAEPSLISKLNTLLQISLVLLVVVDLWRQLGLQSYVDVMIWMVAATTILSGVGYVTEWGGRARKQGMNQQK
jgi:cardiolipin synthase